MTLTRRNLFVTATLGAALGSTFVAAPALADDVWTEEFMTRPENRQGFLVDQMDDWQTANARFIIAVCAGHGIGVEGTRIALITAIVESWLYNYEPAVDHDSGGLFQQRPSMGWGTYDEVRHKKKAIDAFLGFGAHASPPGMIQVAPDYKTWDPGVVAQSVQGSAHPERYGAMVPAAQAIWERHAHDVRPVTG